MNIFEEKTEKINRIKSICPDSIRRIYIDSGWCPAYTDKQTGKHYAECHVYCSYDTCYYARIVFWGAGNDGLGKTYRSENIDEVINMYREYKKYARKLKCRNNLDMILIKNNFKLVVYIDYNIKTPWAIQERKRREKMLENDSKKHPNRFSEPWYYCGKCGGSFHGSEITHCPCLFDWNRANSDYHIVFNGGEIQKRIKNIEG